MPFRTPVAATSRTSSCQAGPGWTPRCSAPPPAPGAAPPPAPARAGPTPPPSHRRLRRRQPPSQPLGPGRLRTHPGAQPCLRRASPRPRLAAHHLALLDRPHPHDQPRHLAVVASRDPRNGIPEPSGSSDGGEAPPDLPATRKVIVSGTTTMLARQPVLRAGCADRQEPGWVTP